MLHENRQKKVREHSERIDSFDTTDFLFLQSVWRRFFNVISSVPDCCQEVTVT